EFALGQENRNRSDRAQLAGPFIFRLWKLSGVRLSLEVGSVALDPISLLGKAGQQKESLHPAVGRLTQLTATLKLFRRRHQSFNLFLTNQGVATGARENTRCKITSTVSANRTQLINWRGQVA